MVYRVNLEALEPDEDERSLRHLAKGRKNEILRDTYFLIDPETSPSRTMKMGLTIVYPTGRTTGHEHPDLEEVYYVLSGRGEMVVGDEEFPIQEGDAFHVPPGAYHVTRNIGIQPLKLLWVTAQVRNTR